VLLTALTVSARNLTALVMVHPVPTCSMREGWDTHFISWPCPTPPLPLTDRADPDALPPPPLTSKTFLVQSPTTSSKCRQDFHSQPLLIPPVLQDPSSSVRGVLLMLVVVNGFKTRRTLRQSHCYHHCIHTHNNGQCGVGGVDGRKRGWDRISRLQHSPSLPRISSPSPFSPLTSLISLLTRVLKGFAPSPCSYTCTHSLIHS